MPTGGRTDGLGVMPDDLGGGVAVAISASSSVARSSVPDEMCHINSVVTNTVLFYNLRILVPHSHV